MAMDSKHDWQLLHEYATGSSQSAFEELVHRYIDLVYSSALRQVKDTHLAEDVSQAVFIILSQKAAALASQKPGVLAGWLFKVTKYTAANAIKMERRRREHEAKVMSETPIAIERDTQDEPWNQIAPHLDDAMSDLSEADRNVILMRFFSNRSHDQIATTLNISEDASKKRLSRAIGRLRGLILRRAGIFRNAKYRRSLNNSWPANLLLAHAIQTAPAHLSSTCAKLGGASAAAILAKGALLTMTLSKIKTAAVLVIVILLVTAAGGVAVQQITRKRTESPIAIQTAAPNFTVPRATQKKSITGIVKDNDGHPVAGADIRVASQNMPVSIYDNRSVNAGQTKTATDGSFSLDVNDAPFYLIVNDNAGYAQLTREQLAASAQITLQPWARIEGIAKIGSKPAAGITITANRFPDWQSPYSGLLNHQQTTTTDLTGRFLFARVAPGNTWVCRKTHAPWDIYEALQFVPVESGKTAQASLGGIGRPVVGRLSVPPGADEKIEWKMQKNASFSAGLMFAGVALISPEPHNNLSWEEQRLYMENWEKTPFGQEFRRNGSGLSVWIEPDGSFRIEDVPPGIHRLFIRAFRNETGTGNEPIVQLEMPVKVDLPEGAQSDEPVDLGNLTLTILPHLGLGKQASAFTVHDLDGNQVKLSDFAGKFLLLVIWSEQRRPSDDDIAFIKLAHERNAKSGKLAILTIEMNHDAQAAKKLAQDTGLDDLARHTIGQFSRGALRDHFAKDIIPPEYLQFDSLITLIDPEGKVAAKNLTGAKIELSVYQAIFSR